MQHESHLDRVRELKKRKLADNTHHYLDFEERPNCVSLIDKDEHQFFELKVVSREQISHDSYRYILKFPDPEWVSGQWPGGYFIFNLKVEGEWVQRKYTPISPLD